MTFEPLLAVARDDAVRHRRGLVFVYLMASLIFGGLLWAELLRVDEAFMAAARERGQTVFRLVEITREWNTHHGGVYVPVTDEMQPNPYLVHPRRDLITSDGRPLTMVNPAFMTRQIAEISERTDGVRLHITSLRPVRPANQPDAWEAEALEAFESGVPERLALVDEERGPVHRYMAPLRVAESCLPCHAGNEYRVGDVHGGISVTMPAGPLLALRDAQRQRVAGLFLLAFVLSAGSIHYLLAAARRHVGSIARINAEQERLIAQRTGELAASNAGLAREIAQRLRDQRRLAASEARYRAVFDSTAEGIMLIDDEMRVLQVNPAFTRITGYEEDEVRGRGLELLGAGRHDQAFFDAIRRMLADTGRWQGEVWNRRKSGDAYVQWMSITRASLPGEAAAFVATLTDITLRKEAEQRMQYRADHDALTGLPNRALFQDRLDAALASAHRNGGQFAVLFIDLDRFKAVNDSLGHPAGDALLVEAGARILGCVRESDTVARFGGDEFAAILPDAGGVEDAREVAQRICAALAEPFMLQQGRAQVAGSVGIALSPMHGSDRAGLESRADQALYAAKRAGGGRWCVYAGAVQAGGA
ncbi:diguanylate cyclase domain-containing protein [Thauera linaloolentis]|uniref:PAS/PAC sensor-containing diguanylate cyclase n=1 Tax=Thauera linaloolentis (strain DSM 12138 / JCM 21573 / CCUG 41526 / CIP 105981 / IAM 15112 / NBRC 102519 / 47Lol) TaxID=1123367 RepID=N6YC88_THAL4|nr:diguanylate cyclase [Thauera linaloolentis]ENO89145.1 PAS/PAC sensor-containing diguanylate cyclase [Thauera linaloolentis 47Lol = DSM 12138]MCM8565708.1 diguanylate cyclase [Thauera linaloolentis]